VRRGKVVMCEDEEREGGGVRVRRGKVVSK
jgi:hypothetical protein